MDTVEEYAIQFLEDCIEEADGDIMLALDAAELILSAEEDTTSIDAFFAHDIYDTRAQGILNRSMKVAKALGKLAKQELETALSKDRTYVGEAILKWLEKWRVKITNLLSATQLASLLEGAREIARDVPVLSDFPGAVPPPPTLPPKEALALVERLAAMTVEDRAAEIYELPQDQQVYVQQAISSGEAYGPEVPPPFTPTAPPANSPEGIHFPIIEEATKNLSEKNVLTRDRFDALDAAAKAKSFTVANVQAEETLTKVRDVLAENVEKGASYDTFRQAVLEAVDEGTFMSPWHMETVFRTNVQSAFSDGKQVVLNHPLVRSAFPYVRYDSIHDNRVRPEHRAMDELGIQGTNIYRINDPVFQTFRPPWDYNCRCGWSPTTVDHAAEQGINEAKEWLETGVEPSPPAFVPMPPFEPPPGFQRAVSSAPLSIQLSLQSLRAFTLDQHGLDHVGKGHPTGGRFTPRGVDDTDINSGQPTVPTAGSALRDDVSEPDAGSEGVEGPAPGTPDAGTGKGGEGPSEPVSIEPDPAIQRAPKQTADALRKLDDLGVWAERTGNHPAAQWFAEIRKHMEAMGVEEAMAAMPPTPEPKGPDELIAYDPGKAYTDGWANNMHAYLNHHGTAAYYDAAGVQEKREQLDHLTKRSEDTLASAGYTPIYNQRTGRVDGIQTEQGDFFERDTDEFNSETAPNPLIRGALNELDEIAERKKTLTQATSGEARRVISTITPKAREGSAPEYPEGTNILFRPAESGLTDKLKEARNLPGLETSEDLNTIMGRPVTHVDEELTNKLDEKYGKGQWIIKPYTEDAFAGHGIHFADNVVTDRKDVKNTIYTAEQQLGKLGFKILRDEVTGKISGLVGPYNDSYTIGTPEYETLKKRAEKTSSQTGQLISKLPDLAASEHGIPMLDREGNVTKPKEDGTGHYMAQPAFPALQQDLFRRQQGFAYASTEARGHYVTKNGQVEQIPYSTFYKDKPFPIVFQDPDSKAIHEAIHEAIMAQPESERQGQVYAPDVIKTGDPSKHRGFKVVELNPSNEVGSSGHFGTNPLIMDAYTSHFKGQDPGFVKFIKRVMTTRGGRGGRVGEMSGQQRLAEQWLKSHVQQPALSIFYIKGEQDDWKSRGFELIGQPRFGRIGGEGSVSTIRKDSGQLGDALPSTLSDGEIGGEITERTDTDRADGVSGDIAKDDSNGSTGGHEPNGYTPTLSRIGAKSRKGLPRRDPDVSASRPDNGRNLREAPRYGRVLRKLDRGATLSDGSDGRGSVYSVSDVDQAIVDQMLSVDPHGHHHKGKGGPGGGQFTRAGVEEGDIQQQGPTKRPSQVPAPAPSGGGGPSGTGGTEGVPRPDTGAARSKYTAKYIGGTPIAEVQGALKAQGVEPLPDQWWEGKTPDEGNAIWVAHGRQILAAAAKLGILAKKDDFARIIEGNRDVGGGEHEVYEEPDTNKFYKFTRAYGYGFGLNKDIYDYLQRIEFANGLSSALGYRFEGIVRDPDTFLPQIAFSMNRIEGEHPEQEDIHRWFESLGFEPAAAPDKWSGAILHWRDPKTGTVIGDTHDQNFIKTSEGLAPIDVNITQKAPETPESLAPTDIQPK